MYVNRLFGYLEVQLIGVPIIGALLYTSTSRKMIYIIEIYHRMFTITKEYSLFMSVSETRKTIL